MTVNDFDVFLDKSGLKIKRVGEVIDVPGWVLSRWKTNRTTLTKNQLARLESFCEEFVKSNAYMQ